jgi:2-keto-4-pentenoate hydratase
MDSAKLATTDEIAARLVHARLERRPLEAYPGPLPSSLEEGYRIQEAAIARWPDEIAGWKIGLVAPEMRARLGSDRIAGPIFSRDVRTARAGETVTFPVFTGGFAAVEGEFVFRMAADAPANKTSWTDAEAMDLVAAVHIGVETAGSPMAAINDLGSTVVSSDFGNNFGVILGPEIDNWRTRLNDIRVTTTIDGREVGAGNASVLPGGPIAGLNFLLAHLASRARPLRKGQLISSGAITGVHDILAGQTSVITFASVGRITCKATPA